MKSRLALTLVLLAATLAVSGNQPASSAAAEGVSNRLLAADAAQALLGAGEDPGDHAMAHMVATAPEMGLFPDDVTDMVVTNIVETASTGATNVYIQQRLDGIEVFGAIANVTIDSSGAIVSTASRFFPGLRRSAPDTTPVSSILVASVAASRALGLVPSEPFESIGPAIGIEQRRQVSDGGISRNDIPVRLVMQPTDTGLRLAWELTIEEIESDNWWQIRVDADSGIELSRNNLVASDTYEVYDAPTEAPSFGPRTTVANPADPTASPFGWFDTNGVAGPESTLTQGNNVVAYTDTDGDNIIDPGSQPDGGPSLLFNFPINLAAAPLTYADALVTNLFYWNNTLHDTFYAYGFNEVAGNFQQNNYGNGGAGGDAVRAEALDGSGANNANFATPPDGFAPRMQMFVWTSASPDRGSSFDNGIIAHEYGHGISTRLTGGPSNVACLTADETAGEGWSDYFGLMTTIEVGDTGLDPRPIGTYVLGQSPAGSGIRDFPYSTSLATDPRTYDSIKTASVPHGVGSTFATMLWEMTWALIDRDGFDPDLINGTGGNITAMQLVIDGLKLQACNPGFTDARDAIVLADNMANGGANECLIWTAFAKRGLGFSATQGSSTSIADGVEAFDLPPQCSGLAIVKSVDKPTVAAGAQLVYSIEVRNNSTATHTGVNITDPIPNGTSYVFGSANCGGSEAAGIVTFPIGTLAPGAMVTCSFTVTVDSAPASATLLTDDFESGTANWTISNGVGTANWAESTANPASGATAMFALDVPTDSDQYLATTSAIPISPLSILRFQHDFVLENLWDGGVVEVSTDGVVWNDVEALFIENGYTATLNASTNTLANRMAFTGSSGGYIQSAVNLGSFAGSNVFIRFRLGTDSIIGAPGWYVDDVVVRDEVTIVNTATVTSNEGTSQQSTATSAVDENLRLTVLPQPCVVYASTSATATGLTGPLTGAEGPREVQVTGPLTGQGGAGSCVPAGSSAVVFTVSAVDAAGAGNLRLSAAGVLPNGGVVNYVNNGLNNANTVTVPVSAGGAVDVKSNVGTTHVRLTAVGYYSSAGTLTFFPLTPCAAADSRVIQGATGSFAGPFAAGAAFPDVDVVGTFPTGQGGDPAETGPTRDCGVPGSADAVVVNLVAVNTNGGTGFLSVGTGGSDPIVEPATPFASLGMNNAATAIVNVDAPGTLAVDIDALTGAPSTEIRVVVMGYLQDMGGSDYLPLNPCAAFDTRSNQGATGGFAGNRVGGQTTTYQISGTFPTAQGGDPTELAPTRDCGVPAGASAVLVNLVAANPVAPGNLRAFATGTIPSGGLLNFADLTPAMNNSNAVIIPLSAMGELDVFTNGGPAGVGNPMTQTRGVILGYYS